MKIKIIIICLSCLCILSFCKHPEEPISPLEKVIEIQNQIGQTWTDYNAFLEREQIDSIMKYFTEKCIIMPNYGLTIKGKEELKEMFVEFFRNNSVKITNHVSTELMIHRDDIFEIGEFDQLIVTSKEDTLIERGRYIALFQRQEDERWKFHRWFYQPEK